MVEHEAPAWMVMALMPNTEPKVFCTAHLRSPETGYRVANCTLPQGHISDHVDVHEGVIWPNLQQEN